MYFLSTPKFCARAVIGIGSSQEKFEAHFYEGIVCPSSNCMYTACNKMYFVRAAAVCSTRKKQKYSI